MERSSYLEWMDRTLLTRPYKSGKEAWEEEALSLRVLIQLHDQVRAGAVSLAFAQKDWELASLHIRSRREASAAEGQRMGCLKVSRALSLNGAERLMLLMAAAFRAGGLEKEALSRMRGDKRKETASQEAAEYLYGFLCRLEGREPEEARSEKTALFLKPGSSSEQEAPMILRTRVLEELRGIKREGSLGGVLIKFCRRRTRADLPLEVFVYRDLLEKMKGMCQKEAGDWSLLLWGEKGSGKEFLSRHLAAFLGRDLLVVDGRALAQMKKNPVISTRWADAREWEPELLCECLLSGDLLYVKEPEEEDFRTLRRELSGLLLTGMEPETEEEERRRQARIRERCVFLELCLPSAEQKAKLWAEFLKDVPHSAKLNPSVLGSKYVLNAGGIRRALDAAFRWAMGNGKECLGEEEICWAVHQSEAGQLGSFACAVPLVFGWEDLIVEDRVKTQLSYICGRIKYRNIVGNQWGFFEKMPYGKGLCALFYGPPGTGKTMAVQVIARELGLDLYRVDLSRMVSKYIGETEKNISALFEKAGRINGILFFDEADSFFSRRSEVKDANDRNANAEVSYLLQRLEEYEGITILATNLKENIDDAFKRRIQFMVNFCLPSAETRKRLWNTLLPPGAPREESLDLEYFARHFELSGSQIKEILLQAAYMAAGEGHAIGNRQIKEALCLNYEKYGKFLTKEDFGYLG